MNNDQHPARRLRHGDRPTEPLSFDDEPAGSAEVASIERAAAPVRFVEADECAAAQNGHRFGPHGRKGEIQCEWCGESSAYPATASGDERAMFEAEERKHSSNLNRQPSDGQYENPCTQSAWEGWQARAAVSAATKPTADSELRTMIRAMATALNNGEWANVLTTDADLSALDAEISNLVSRLSDAATKPAPLADINAQQLVNDLCNIAVTFHSKSALHERIFGAVSQYLAIKPAAAPAVPEAVRLAGVKMANTMFNLAQRAGEVIDSDLCSSMDKMRKEWDAAIRALRTPAAGAEGAE